MTKTMRVLAMTLATLMTSATIMLGWVGVAGAQTDSDASPELKKFSVQTGIGFFAGDGSDGKVCARGVCARGDLDGFMINMGGLYHIDHNWSAGVDLQIGVDDHFVLLSMPFYGRYDFGNLPVDVQELAKIRPFVKLGMGFTYAEFDGGPRDIDDTGFLFLMGGGISYPINRNVTLESTMQFNITTNDFFEDDFYFSWELLSIRYSF